MKLITFTIQIFLLLISLSSSWASILPAKARATLEAGNRRFAEGKAIAHGWQKGIVTKTGALGQTPSVAVLTCSDSRTPVELIFDMGVGDLFVCRNAGGFDTPEVNATFEYGVAALGVHTILVLGHTKCEALTRYQMVEVIKNSALLQKAQADNKLQIMGAIYDVDTGLVRFLD
ncbi:MAG: hypothetical protein NTZ01_00095 [Verrucomicrobia bacterium]|nr:hypothetical protein [Verrucomicrobiota bacterium]